MMFFCFLWTIARRMMDHFHKCSLWRRWISTRIHYLGNIRWWPTMQNESRASLVHDLLTSRTLQLSSNLEDH
jgi:hypothetical protein